MSSTQTAITTVNVGEPAVLGNVAQQQQEAEAEADPGGAEHRALIAAVAGARVVATR